MKQIVLPLLLFFLATTWIGATDYISHIDVAIDAYPGEERMSVEATLHFNPSASGKRLYYILAPPANVEECVDASSDDEIEYHVEPPPEPYRQYSAGTVEFDLPRFEGTLLLRFVYEYDRATFTGYGLNPGTWDNLYFGQITEDSVFSSHLFYYPFPIRDEEIETADLTISVPAGWLGVSSGALVSEESIAGRAVFRYRCDFASGILAYPLAFYPYESLRIRYDDRYPVTLYFAKEDRSFAEERMTLLNESILPFLEGLMGPYPFAELRVAEMFPTKGNMGVAMRRMVLISRDTWFGTPIDGDYRRAGATVLVDEIAHQWNFYQVGFPNYLAEAVSQYTDLLYPETLYGRESIEQAIAHMRDEYVRIVDVLLRIQKLKADGKGQDQVAEALGETRANVAALWPFADRGEVPISDPGVMYTLYFEKGAVALHALRNRLGDDLFFSGFRNIFLHTEPGSQMSLEDFRSFFEGESGQDLEEFFRLWFYDIGMPDYR